MKYVSIAIAIFVLIMVWMGYEMVFSTNETPQEDYYEQDLGYDKLQEAQQNVAKLSAKPIIKHDKSVNFIEVTLPTEIKNPEGRLQILKTSDQSQDISFQLTAENIQQFTLPANLKGLCNIIISWKSEGKNFLYKEKIML
ncbi:MAG: hypothetical protein EAZ08_11815 [Cytophagales bacterium]|nr:MAG: hypothetical protein EAZ08_11815 [Cytophagales bacterium]